MQEFSRTFSPSRYRMSLLYSFITDIPSNNVSGYVHLLLEMRLASYARLCMRVFIRPWILAGR